MLSKPQLKRLVDRYVLDAQVLLNNRRYATSIYLSGYAVELALKYKICKIFKFNLGYPESSLEFNLYLKGSGKRLSAYIKDVRNLKIHDLSKLLEYSGEKVTIESTRSAEWAIVENWNVLSRYDGSVVRRSKANDFCEATNLVLSALL
jgi:HEPN domain-containing protein